MIHQFERGHIDISQCYKLVISILSILVVSAVLYGLAYFLYPVNNMACQDEVVQNINAIDKKQGKKDVEDDTKL